MRLNRSVFTSDSSEWETPQDLFDDLNFEFNFTLDPCATKKNAKCKNFFTNKENGLLKSWVGEVVFMNPPYGRDIKDWVKKAWMEAQFFGNCTVVCLLPSRTDTKWWHDYVIRAQDIRFIKGRLKFSGHKNSAPFPSAIVVFKQAVKK